MDFGALLGRGSLLIGALVLVGASLLVMSLIINYHVADSVRDEHRHREKLLEYHRNIFSQLGVILIGIGISLFIFYFQQTYQERSRRNAELQQIVSKMALRTARGAAAVASLSEFDELLDDGGPYVNPVNGGANSAVAADGAALTAQIEKLLMVERDVDLRELEVLAISRDLENSTAAGDLDPNMWFNIVRDESDVRYAINQLILNFRDLRELLGGEPVDIAFADPEKSRRIKQEVLDIFYDAELLRQRGRRLVARACWLLSHGAGFVFLQPAEEIETDASSHLAWLEQARPFLTQFSLGSGNCFGVLGYRDAAWSLWDAGG